LPPVAKGNLAMNRAKSVVIGVFITYLCFRFLVCQEHVWAWGSYIRAYLEGVPLRAAGGGLIVQLMLAFTVRRLILYRSSFA